MTAGRVGRAVWLVALALILVVPCGCEVIEDTLEDLDLPSLSGDEDEDDDSGDDGTDGDDSDDADDDDDKSDVPKVARIILSGAIPETEDPLAMFGGGRASLRTLIKRIEDAAADDDVGAALVVIRPMFLGWARGMELRAALARFKESKKPLVAYLESGRDLEYAIASVADEVLMPPAGDLMITGLLAESLYVKDLLSDAGVEADFESMGKYKSAAETLTRDEPSDAAKESMEALLDDTFRVEVETIAAARKLTPDEVRKIIDNGPYLPADALSKKLVDGLMNPTELGPYMASKLGGEVLVIHNYGADTKGLDSSNPMALIQALLRPPKPKRSGKPVIALFNVTGPIVHGEAGGTSMFGGDASYSGEMLTAIRAIEADKDVVAVVVRVNSPGGSANASDMVFEALKALDAKTPVIASMGDVAASGGYYIPMAARTIFAEAATITGSIGVVGGKIVLGGTYKKLGIATWSASRGKNAGLLSSTSAFSASERKAFKRIMKGTYDTFVFKAAGSRDMPVEELAKVAEGRVWSGTAALAAKLVDEIGDLEDALEAAKKAAKIDGEYDVVVFHPRRKGLAEVLAGSGVRAGTGFGFSGTGGLPPGPALLGSGAGFAAALAGFPVVGPELVMLLSGEPVLTLAPALPLIR